TAPVVRSQTIERSLVLSLSAKKLPSADATGSPNVSPAGCVRLPVTAPVTRFTVSTNPAHPLLTQVPVTTMTTARPVVALHAASCAASLGRPSPDSASRLVWTLPDPISEYSSAPPWSVHQWRLSSAQRTSLVSCGHCAAFTAARTR